MGGAEGVAMALTEGGPGQERWREQGSTPPHESIISVLPSQVHLLCIYTLASETIPLALCTMRVPVHTYVDHTFHTVMFLLHT